MCIQPKSIYSMPYGNTTNYIYTKFSQINLTLCRSVANSITGIRTAIVHECILIICICVRWQNILKNVLVSIISFNNPFDSESDPKWSEGEVRLILKQSIYLLYPQFQTRRNNWLIIVNIVVKLHLTQYNNIHFKLFEHVDC